MRAMTKMRAFAKGISDHFVANHLNTEDDAQINATNSKAKSYTILAIDYPHCQQKLFGTWEIVRYEPLKTTILVIFLPSEPERYSRVRHYNSQIFYVPSGTTKEKAKQIDCIYRKELDKIHFAYSVKLDKAGNPGVIDQCYQSKLHHFDAIASPGQNSPSPHVDKTTNNQRTTCSIM